MNKKEIELETFCALNNNREDFNLDECEEGALCFKVPTDWLMNIINELDCFPEGCNLTEIRDINNLREWLDYCTYNESEKIYLNAVCENVIIGSISVDCEYCK